MAAAFFVSPPDITGHRLEAVVCGKIQITRIKDRSVAGEALQNGRLKIVVHSAPGACTVVFQRVAVGGQEAFHTLAQEELHKEQPAITEHRSEVMEFAHTVVDAHQAVSCPVDLHTIARFKGQFEEGLVADWPHRGNEVVEDGSAASVTMFRAQTLKDLHSGVGMFFQPVTNGLDIEPGLCGDLSGSQLQLPTQTAYFVIGFKVDHSLAPPFCRRLSTIALSDRPLMAPMAWGSELAAGRCAGWLCSRSSPSKLRS